MNDDQPRSGHANYSKLQINELVDDYETIIVEFTDGTSQEIPRSTMIGVTELKFDKPAKVIKFVRPSIDRASHIELQQAKVSKNDIEIDQGAKFKNIQPWKINH